MKSNDTYMEPVIIEDKGWTIRVFRPILTDEERNRRMEELKKATIALLRDNPPKGGAARGCCAR